MKEGGPVKHCWACPQREPPSPGAVASLSCLAGESPSSLRFCLGPVLYRTEAERNVRDWRRPRLLIVLNEQGSGKARLGVRRPMEELGKGRRERKRRQG